jgi:hypothetical protein
MLVGIVGLGGQLQAVIVVKRIGSNSHRIVGTSSAVISQCACHSAKAPLVPENAGVPRLGLAKSE